MSTGLHDVVTGNSSVNAVLPYDCTVIAIEIASMDSEGIGDYKFYGTKMIEDVYVNGDKFIWKPDNKMLDYDRDINNNIGYNIWYIKGDIYQAIMHSLD